MNEIQLTEDEQHLFLLVLNQGDNQNYDKINEAFEASSTLMHALLDRKAIPDVRIRYFAVPNFNNGRSKMSHKQIFENNGTKVKEIVEVIEGCLYAAKWEREKTGSYMKMLNELDDDNFVKDYLMMDKDYLFSGYFHCSTIVPAIQRIMKKKMKKSPTLAKMRKMLKEKHWRTETSIIALRILYALEEKGITQKDLAKKMRKSPQ